MERQKHQNDTKYTIRDQVLKLYTFGVDIQTIADILGTSRNSIDLHLSALRKNGRIDAKSTQNMGLNKNDTVEKERIEENGNPNTKVL